jgi:hypothetical protein
MKRALIALGLTAVFVGSSARAEAPAAPAAAVSVDRAVVRFWAPDTGGVTSPRFVYYRVLAFEARLEALADPNRGAQPAPYRERHVSDALERHVAETVLSSLHIDPEPSDAELARQMEAARARLVQRAGSEEALFALTAAEGLGPRDLLELTRRQARASLYLDRMVATMLQPSEAELRTLHRTRNTPFRALPFEQIEPGLRRWYVAQRLASAVQSYYQNARSRIVLTLLGDLPGGAVPDWASSGKLRF